MVDWTYGLKLEMVSVEKEGFLPNIIQAPEVNKGARFPDWHLSFSALFVGEHFTGIG